MTAEERCDLSGLLRRECACRRHGPKPEPAGRIQPSFMAQYAGTCSECEEDITPGDQIMLGEHGYRHWACP